MSLESYPLTKRCDLHAARMYREGWYTTGNVLWKAAERIRQLEAGVAEARDHLTRLQADLAEVEERLRCAERREPSPPPRSPTPASR